MAGDFSEARQQRFRDDKLFQDRATHGVRRRGMATPSAQEGEVTESDAIPPEFLEGLSEADATLTQAFYGALVSHYESQNFQPNPSGFSIEEQLGNSARALLEAAHQQFDFWAARAIRLGGQVISATNEAEIIGPVTESLLLTPEEVEQVHAVVAAIEAERQARQPSRRPSRQELSPTKQPSESALALQAMTAAAEQQLAVDQKFVAESQDLLQGPTWRDVAFRRNRPGYDMQGE